MKDYLAISGLDLPPDLLHHQNIQRLRGGKHVHIQVNVHIETQCKQKDPILHYVN